MNNEQTANKIRDRVREIVCENSGATEVSSEAELVNDLGFDSLDMIELVMDIEDEFDIQVPDETAERWVTVSDVEKFVLADKGIS